MALVYYETGIRLPTEDGGYDYVNVFVTQNEEEARLAYQADRRNYLARLSFDDHGTCTEFWNAQSGAWEAQSAS